MEKRQTLPEYWQEAQNLLSRECEVMAGIISQFPAEHLHSDGTSFKTLANAIIGQQISVKAAEAIWGRLMAHVGVMEPEAALRADEEALRALGLSRQKVVYLKHLAEFFQANPHMDSQWHGMEDAEVLGTLCSIKGIGVWTAEMFMIFHLLRPDVFPLGDVGLVKAVQKHYAGGAKLSKEEVAAYGERWRPYRTVATWYLWRSLDPVPVRY